MGGEGGVGRSCSRAPPLTSQKEKAAKEALVASISAIVVQQDALKKKLYARFGRSINLEDK